jgi:hypothetical protein
MKTLHKTLFWVLTFSISMGFLESAVVIYLRELYYKTGFEFPLQPVEVHIAKVEFLRELATVIMLIAVGILAGRNKLERFAYFVIAFAVWDLFYYVFLYLCIGWPKSLITWDILFLIPVPWVGPVWAPCLLCILMIIGALSIILQIEKNHFYSISIVYWWMMISGAFVCIVSFMWDYLAFTYQQKSSSSIIYSGQLFSDMATYTPQKFNHTLFFTGFLLMSISLVLSTLKSIKK